MPADSPLVRHDDLVGEVLRTFDRLVPLFACAADADPTPVLTARAGGTPSRPRYDRAAFAADTFLPADWLPNVAGLFAFKKQVVLQGVPGTGKTHVARCLARYLAHDNPAAVAVVQFHPGFSYEEFVEGIKARTADMNGTAVTNYPVEDGVLVAFAARAAARPAEPHVLVIDELNRGNLPRIFGEMLYLLEYRDQAVTLPYSRRDFRLPDNLLVVATMNPTDRSAGVLDQALRRRFSFVDMPPDGDVLGRWLAAHPPADPDPTFPRRLVRALDTLNRKLAAAVGPDKQVGHSLFMLPGLDRDKLAAVWDHHLRPQLVEYLGGRDDRVGGFDLLKLVAAPLAPRVRPPEDAPVGG